MEVIFKGDPKEIAALAVAVHERREDRCYAPLETIMEAVRQAVGGTAEALQDSL